MLSDRKILITGPAGQIAFPMATYLAQDNEVWGIARFGDEGSRERVEALGVTTRVVDLASGDFGDLPGDFDHVIHLATYQGGGHDYDQALRVNAEGTGFLLDHCRRARSVLVASTFSVYAPNPDPGFLFDEAAPLGDAHLPHSPTYSVSKIAQEAVARTMARALDLPVTIGRINASYGPNGGLPAYMLDWLVRGDPVYVRHRGQTYHPIHQDDLNRQAGLLLDVASVPATIVNWAGDEVLTVEEMVGSMAELIGTTPDLRLIDAPLSSKGNGSDNTKRLELIGPCRVRWRDGLRAMLDARHPDGRAADTEGASRLATAYEDMDG